MAASVFLAAVLALQLLHVARGEIKTTPIVSDSRPVILFEEFGFKPGGVAQVSVSGVSWSVPEGSPPQAVDPGLMGFILISNTLFFKITNESDSCQDGVEITMDVRTEMYNLPRPGGDREYLPVGLLPLPGIFAASSVVYFAFLAAWVFVCIKQRATVERIHAVMGALLLFKALKLACAAEDAWYVGRTGTPHGWDVAFYVFGFFKGILLFTVIVLIGTGWSFLKPYLQEREKNVLMIIIPLQVIENIASAMIGETGPAGRDWLAWNQIFLLVDVVCCCAVFFPIIWSIRNLREASKTDGKAARNLKKLTLFKQFYLVVVGYLYFTRIAVSAFAAVLSYKYQWVVNVSVELASLAFYVFVFYNFQPVERNPYLYVADEEEEAAGGQLELEGTFEI
ncbi:unnamed protein product [Triticum turgidum subsp. durum]|uniref:Protein GPR107 n=1 Tax=Triticum turgidum subsp. durum TaxID=4567 RepID=A0A9R1PTT3_TRITD|nr:unnamed protein product [Triticum turgidum subsp. durum]